MDFGVSCAWFCVGRSIKISRVFCVSRLSGPASYGSCHGSCVRRACKSTHIYTSSTCSFIFAHSYYMQICVSCNGALEPLELHRCDMCNFRIHSFGKSSFVGCVITQRSDVDDDSRLLCRHCALIVNNPSNALAALSAVTHDGQNQQSALGNVGSTQV